jgi:hypothetical protein
VPSFSAALGLAAALGFFLRVGVLCCVVIRGDPRTPLLRCARNGRCARLGILRRACELGCGSRGRPRTPLLRCARPGSGARFGFLRRECELDCRSRGRPPNPPSSRHSALSLRSVWSSSACVRVRLFWFGETPQTPLLRCLRPGRESVDILRVLVLRSMAY